MNQCPGFDILYMGNAKPTSQSVSGIENHSSILIPTYHYSFDLTNKTSSLMFTLDTSFMKVKPGYYVFYITPLLSDSKYKNFIYLKYLNQVFRLAWYHKNLLIYNIDRLRSQLLVLMNYCNFKRCYNLNLSSFLHTFFQISNPNQLPLLSSYNRKILLEWYRQTCFLLHSIICRKLLIT